MDVYKEDITDDYQQFFEEDYNVVIYAGEGSNIEEFHAHSIILRCRSQYFQTALSPNWAKKEDGKYILLKPNISGTIFQMILRYIYSGVIDFSKIKQTEYLELLKAADELVFDKIVESLQGYLINRQDDYLKQDPIGMLQIALLYKQLIPLKNFCIDIICQEAENLFKSKKLLTISSQYLELLLQQDKLALEEIDIWDYLIRWAYVQNPFIEIDPSRWTEYDIEIMRQTMGSLIPLIRFQNISSKDYFDKVSPYEKLLPKENILKIYSTISDLKLYEFDSSIIIAQKDLYYSLLLNWINEKDKISKTRNFFQYEFKLIFRGSKDGFDANSFHEKCDHKGATITLIKIMDSNQIVGGYNPLGWEGEGSRMTSDSFIFLFDDFKDVNSGKIGRVIKTKRAIRCFNDWGPIFGAYNTITKSNDLSMYRNGEWVSVPSSYPDLKIPSKFKVDDYEVFQIVTVPL